MADENNVDGDKVIHHSIGDPKSDFPPLFSSYNETIRPMLDAVDNLRRQEVVEEGITVPPIVVIGDGYSGKTSVIDSLVGIRLPRTVTKVPLKLRFQNDRNPVPEILLEYQKKSVPIMEESLIPEAIDRATAEITGNLKGKSNVTLTLVIKKKGNPDLTIIDLPDVVIEYIKPKDSIILNVVPAGCSLLTSESMCVSKQVDNTGERTLAVITKCDQSTDDIIRTSLVTARNAKIRLGYIFVRNRINDETHGEARIREATFFETHPSLSNFDVGIHALAERLVYIQSDIIARYSLTVIIKIIRNKLHTSKLELNELPQSSPHGMTGFMQIIGSFEETLNKILIRSEFDEYMDDREMHGNARLVEMLDQFSEELHTSIKFSSNFLVEEMEVLEQANGIWLPYFVPHTVFLCLLRRKINSISQVFINFVNKVWGYLDSVCVRVLVDCSGNYAKLLSSMRTATRNVMEKTKDRFMERIVEMIDMEKITDYTCDPNYIVSWNKLMGSIRDEFFKLFHNHNINVDGVTTMHVEGHGMIQVKHLLSVSENMRNQAFDLKMRMTAYLEIVFRRMVDWTALQLQFWLKKMVNKEIYTAVVNQVIKDGSDTEKIPNERPSVARKKEKLQRSIELLEESKGDIGGLINGVPIISFPYGY